MPRSRENLRSRMCDGKVQLNRGSARRVAARARARSDEKISPYRCHFCPHWHVGHAPSMEWVQDLATAIREEAYPNGDLV